MSPKFQHLLEQITQIFEAFDKTVGATDKKASQLETAQIELDKIKADWVSPDQMALVLHSVHQLMDNNESLKQEIAAKESKLQFFTDRIKQLEGDLDREGKLTNDLTAKRFALEAVVEKYKTRDIKIAELKELL